MIVNAVEQFCKGKTVYFHEFPASWYGLICVSLSEKVHSIRIWAGRHQTNYTLLLQ